MQWSILPEFELGVLPIAFGNLWRTPEVSKTLATKKSIVIFQSFVTTSHAVTLDTVFWILAVYSMQ